VKINNDETHNHDQGICLQGRSAPESLYGGIFVGPHKEDCLHLEQETGHSDCVMTGGPTSVAILPSKEIIRRTVGNSELPDDVQQQPSGVALDSPNNRQVTVKDLARVLRLPGEVQGFERCEGRSNPVWFRGNEDRPHQISSGSQTTGSEIFVIDENGAPDLDPAEVKRRAEKLAAKRSLETNFVVILFFFAANIVLLIPSKIWQTYFCVVDTSVQKALLPILSTMANFGTIRSVGKQLWESVINRQE